MVHDDDTSRPVHHVIHSSDRVLQDQPPPPEEVYDLVAFWAQEHSAWGAQRIYREVRKTRSDITVGMIEFVLKQLRRARDRR